MEWGILWSQYQHNVFHRYRMFQQTSSSELRSRNLTKWGVYKRHRVCFWLQIWGFNECPWALLHPQFPPPSPPPLYINSSCNHGDHHCLKRGLFLADVLMSSKYEGIHTEHRLYLSNALLSNSVWKLFYFFFLHVGVSQISFMMMLSFLDKKILGRKQADFQ